MMETECATEKQATLLVEQVRRGPSDNKTDQA